MTTKKELIEDLWKVNTPEEDDKFLLWLCNKGALQDFRNKINLKHSQSLLQQNKEFIEMIDELKTRNIEDEGLDVQTEEYWVNAEELKQKLKGAEK